MRNLEENDSDWPKFLSKDDIEMGIKRSLEEPIETIKEALDDLTFTVRALVLSLQSKRGFMETFDDLWDKEKGSLISQHDAAKEQVATT